jgi:hypothetical protein
VRHPEKTLCGEVTTDQEGEAFEAARCLRMAWELCTRADPAQRADMGLLKRVNTGEPESADDLGALKSFSQSQWRRQ